MRRCAATADWPIMLIEQPEAVGVVAAFERALDVASGADVVLLADQDDRWHPDRIARTLEAMTDPSIGAVWTDAALIDGEGRPLAGRLWSRLEITARQRRRVSDDPPGPLLRHSMAPGCTLAVSRPVLEVALPFPDSLSEPASPMLHDRWLALVASAVAEVRMLERPLIDYRIHAGQSVSARRVRWLPEIVRQVRRSSASVHGQVEARRAAAGRSGGSSHRSSAPVGRSSASSLPRVPG